MDEKYLSINNIKEPLILFSIIRTYDPKNTDSDHVYECTRKFWRIAANRRQTDRNGNFVYPIALGIHNGEVKGVFKIESWELASNINKTKVDYIEYANRWVFEGKPINDSIYLGKILLDSNNVVLRNPQNPVRYIN
jgi:hypothetical protein